MRKHLLLASIMLTGFALVSFQSVTSVVVEKKDEVSKLSNVGNYSGSVVVLKSSDVTPFINDASVPVVLGGPLAHIDKTPFVADGYSKEAPAMARGPTDRNAG